MAKGTQKLPIVIQKIQKITEKQVMANCAKTTTYSKCIAKNKDYRNDDDCPGNNSSQYLSKINNIFYFTV